MNHYYQEVTHGFPTLLWIINSDELRAVAEALEVRETPSSSGDLCHRDIHVVISKGKARQFLIKWCRPPHVFLCDGESKRPITDNEYENLPELFQTMSDSES